MWDGKLIPTSNFRTLTDEDIREAEKIRARHAELVESLMTRVEWHMGNEVPGSGLDADEVTTR